MVYPEYTCCWRVVLAVTFRLWGGSLVCMARPGNEFIWVQGTFLAAKVPRFTSSVATHGAPAWYRLCFGWQFPIGRSASKNRLESSASLESGVCQMLSMFSSVAFHNKRNKQWCKVAPGLCEFWSPTWWVTMTQRFPDAKKKERR